MESIYYEIQSVIQFKSFSSSPKDSSKFCITAMIKSFVAKCKCSVGRQYAHLTMVKTDYGILFYFYYWMVIMEIGLIHWFTRVSCIFLVLFHFSMAELKKPIPLWKCDVPMTDSWPEQSGLFSIDEK